MNTHDTDIEMPAEFRSGNDIPVTQATIKRERMEEILIAAIEADRQINDRMLAHEWIRPVLGLSEDAPYRFDFYAQEIEKLKAELKKSERNGSDKGNENDHRKRRGEPVAYLSKCIKGDSKGHFEICEEDEVVHNTEFWSEPFPVYTAPQPDEPVTTRRAFVCTSCEGVYADQPVSQCECMPDRDEFIEGAISYPATQPAVPATLTDQQMLQIMTKFGTHVLGETTVTFTGAGLLAGCRALLARYR